MLSTRPKASACPYLTRHAITLLLICAGPTTANEPITVADASLSAAFYSDSSCLLTIDRKSRSGKTIIDADMDDEGSRMLIHCDTVGGRRLTLLARGDSLNVSQRVPLLTREEIKEGELGMIAWLTRSGVHYSDDSAPRRYVIAGSVLLRKSPPVQPSDSALNSQRHAFGLIAGILEPLIKSNDSSVFTPLPTRESASKTDMNATAVKNEKRETSVNKNTAHSEPTQPASEAQSPNNSALAPQTKKNIESSTD